VRMLAPQDNLTAAMEKYSDTVYRICYLYLRNKDDADDAFQDVFLRYIQAGKKFDSEEHEKGWLCTVAFNRCKDLLRSSSRKVVSLESVEEPSYRSPAEEGNPVLEAVLQLPVKYKDAIYLHYFEGYSTGQIARILGCGENTVYSQLSRGRQILKERLGDDFEDQ